MDLEKFMNRSSLTGTDEFYHDAVIRLGGPNTFKNYIPFDLETLQKAYHRDKNFNTPLTPMTKWNEATGIYVKPGQTTTPPIATGGGIWPLLNKHGITEMSQSQSVMLLKTAAEMLVLANAS